MLKFIYIALFVCLTNVLAAQIESEQYIHKHLVRADGSIVAGFMPKDNLSNVHVTGNLEYYIDNIVSVRGEATYLLGSTGLTADSMSLKDEISVGLGTAFHFPTNGHFDPYFILEPNLAYTSSYHQNNTILFADTKPKTYYVGSVTPMATAGLGFNYYFQRFAHLFLEGRYVYGQHLSEAPKPISLQEIRVTFGLGFNVFIIKDKKKPG